MSNARQIVDAALGINVYDRYPVQKDPRYGDITAASAETTWKAAGLAVPSALPGDLLFQTGDSPAGHVGIYLGVLGGKALVLENTTAARGRVVGANQWIRLTELEQFGTVTTIIRFPEDEKTPEDLGTPSSALLNTAQLPGPSERDAPFAIPLLDLVNRGAPDAPDTPKVDRAEPTWLYRTLDVHADRAPGALVTTLGTVQSIVVLRFPYESEADHAAPVIGPFSVAGAEWRDRLLAAWGNLKTYLLRRAEWGAIYGPLMDFSLDPSRYRLPLPGITSVNIQHDVSGTAYAEVELHIADETAAEMVLSTLVQGQRLRNVQVECWVPVSHLDRHGNERTVLEPLHTGVIEEVVSSPYPHGVRFRVSAQSWAMNQVGMDPARVRTDWNEQTVAQIVEDIAHDHKLLIVTPSAPTIHDMPSMQRVIPHYNAMGRPPIDVLRELVGRAGGLSFQRLAGTELAGYRLPGLPRSVWAIVDPTAYAVWTPQFWKNTLWSKVYAPLAAAVLPDHEPVGEVAVIAPVGLLNRDPAYVKRLAGVLETYGTPEARRNPLYRFLDALAALGSVVGVGSGPAMKNAIENGVGSALVDYVNGWWTAAGSDAADRVAKIIVPALTIEEFAVRSPDPSELAAPVYGTTAGQTLQGRRTRAGEDARLMGLEAQPDGTFLPTAPGGSASFGASDRTFLSYGRHYARPALLTPSPLGSGEVERVPDFYPSRVTVSCVPRYGLRAGMLAVLVGCGRLDGMYQVESCTWSLNGVSQTLTATLRTQRDLLSI